MAISDSYVQVASDGSGKKIRNLKVSAYIDVNGVPTLTDLYMQVASIVDADGQPIDFEEDHRALRRIFDQLVRLELLFCAAFDLTTREYSDDDETESVTD